MDSKGKYIFKRLPLIKGYIRQCFTTRQTGLCVKAGLKNLEFNIFVPAQQWPWVAGKDQEDKWASAHSSWCKHLIMDRAEFRAKGGPTLPESVILFAEVLFSIARHNGGLLLWCSFQKPQPWSVAGKACGSPAGVWLQDVFIIHWKSRCISKLSKSTIYVTSIYF